MKKKSLKAILSISGYFLLVIALCFVGGLVFHNYYYQLIYVSGSSMYPTLNGADNEQDGTVVDFGIVDPHKSAVDHVKRFSIISTYYYDDYRLNGELKPSPKQKIKRIIALPNETFKIKDGELYLKHDETFELVPYTFNISPSIEDKYQGKDIEETTLEDDEYWVLGDHRDKSRDCGSSDLRKPIKKDYICGVLVAIEGQAKLKVKNYVCSNCGSVSGSDASYCENCLSYGTLTPYKCDLVNKQYYWPRYF